MQKHLKILKANNESAIISWHDIPGDGSCISKSRSGIEIGQRSGGRKTRLRMYHCYSKVEIIRHSRGGS